MIKIAIIGPESTGKSEMAAYLANHYKTLWVREYAREYCTGLDRECTIEDELNMFHGQLKSENETASKLSSKNKILIADTTIITVKVWCEYMFGFCPAEVEKEYINRHYDLYLLMKDDLPWIDDPLRDFPDQREYFFNLYVDLMKEKRANYRIVSGTGEKRFSNAIAFVDEFLKSN